MISNQSSKWGIKRSKENIRTDILDIITNSADFIIIGGYNFIFKTTGYTFFNELYRKSIQGVPILITLLNNTLNIQFSGIHLKVDRKPTLNENYKVKVVVALSTGEVYEKVSESIKIR